MRVLLFLRQTVSRLSVKGLLLFSPTPDRTSSARLIFILIKHFQEEKTRWHCRLNEICILHFQKPPGNSDPILVGSMACL